MAVPRRRILPFFIPFQGCPGRCVFCDQQALTGVTAEAPQPEALERMLAQALALQPPGSQAEAAFYGGSFTALPRQQQQALLAPARRALRQGRLTGIRLSTRPDCLDSQTARWLRTQGVSVVELGVQSLCDAVLARSQRGYQAACVTAAVAALRQAGLQVGVQLMPGLPGEGPLQWLQGLRRLWQLQPDFVRLYPTVVLANTPLAADYLQGRYQPLTLEEAVSRTAWAVHGCRRRGIGVIRVGLQDTPALHSPQLLAGPYHPAFGALVQSFLVRQQVATALEALPPSFRRLLCHRRDESQVRGQKNDNLFYWRRRFGAALHVEAVEVRPGQLWLQEEGGAGRRAFLGALGVLAE